VTGAAPLSVVTGAFLAEFLADAGATLGRSFVSERERNWSAS
jgi:hypothetical protein